MKLAVSALAALCPQSVHPRCFEAAVLPHSDALMLGYASLLAVDIYRRGGQTGSS